MISWLKYVVPGMILLGLADAASAADRVRRQDRKRDGTCQVAPRGGDRVRQQDRKRDGSCIAPRGGIRQQDRKRDGSCR
jgi:hypothetical protein